MPAVALEDMRVAAPCPMSWEQMTGDDRVRHCQECKLNVYNLSDMTRREAESLISSREGRLCVRFYRRADGTVLNRDCPRGLRKQIDRISRFAGAALSALLSLSASVWAQTVQQSTSPVESEAQEQKSAQMVLTVVDPQGAAIPGAKVWLHDKHHKAKFAGTTRADGTVIVSGVIPDQLIFKIEHPGFKPYNKTVKINVDQTQAIRAVLTVADETVVVGMLTAPSTVDHDDSQLKTTLSGDFLRQLPLR
jgi:hypothetical protein